MMCLSPFLSSIYSLENLDTRLTTASSIPHKLASVNVGDDNAQRKGRTTTVVGASAGGDTRTMSPKWHTSEFYFYYFIFIIVIPIMFWVPYEVSRPSDPRYPKFEHLLAPGWIPGRMIDDSDPQYHTFRSNLPYMAALLVLHPLCRRLWNAFHPLPSATKSTAPDQAEERLEQRTSFDFAFAIFFLIILHGFSASKVLLILWANHSLVTSVPRRLLPVVTWIFNISILFANELCQGYRFKDMASIMVGASAAEQAGLGEFNSQDGLLVRTGEWLDSWGGLMSRWEVLFNITVLRLISFNLDYYWSMNWKSLSSLEKRQVDPANLSERDRVSTPPQARDFSFRNYVAYAIYAPLYLVGPIITFNDYISQQRYRVASIELSRTLRYGIRFLVALLAMEVVLHFDYVGAISKARPVWASYTPAQLSLLSYFNLHLIWLKLLLPWRLFRLWSLLDGVDPPENMLRCVSNNFSTLSFWRAWHRSYNRWLIRYMFIPLGGANFQSWKTAMRSMLNYIMIFTFVAMWHDIQLRLLIWGWLIVLFFIPEVAASYIFPRRKWEHRPTAYRMLCCVGGVVNVLMMMAANMVGFAVGLDGLQSILSGIFHDLSGIVFLVVACLALFVGIQIMFEIREAELRKGISLKC